MKTRKTEIHILVLVFFAVLLVQCDNDEDMMPPMGVNPNTAERAVVDRFSTEAGNLFVRNADNNFPEAGEAVNFDESPFITKGLGPEGQKIQYYNFDVMPLNSAPIFVLFEEGEDMPVEGQLNIVDVIPGDAGYSDFWHVHKVTVPQGYVANTITSVAELTSMNYPTERTHLIVNCPVVPEGSTASLRLNQDNKGLIRGWYKDKVVFYFDFSEKQITVELPDEGHPNVPVSDIFVAFNINPGMEGGGPSSGFETEGSSDQTHNVTHTVPADENYSPLWNVNVYDNASFENVSDWATATGAPVLGTGVALVNCPVVSVE